MIGRVMFVVGVLKWTSIKDMYRERGKKKGDDPLKFHGCKNINSNPVPKKAS